MKDIQTILEAYQAVRSNSSAFALATVVKVEGSAYRRPGARMLVTQDGRRFGSLSGGCLEADVAAHAVQAVANGSQTILRYDPNSSNGDVILETGCKGAIEILVEPGTNPDVARSLDFLIHLSEARKTGLIATVVGAEHTNAFQLGDRLLAAEHGSYSGALAHPPLAAVIVEEAAAMGTEEKTRSTSYPTAEGTVHILLERRVPPIALLLCGSGHDTLPLARIAAALGWPVTVADPNSSALTTERYPDAHAILPVRPECLPAKIAIDDRTVAVFMTHNYALDLEWFRQLLPSKIAYIGVLGPRRRWMQIQHDLTVGGHIPPDCDLARVYSPAGLDIGSETPEEIAVAIVAEIQAVMSGRAGGFLRGREAASSGLTTGSDTLSGPTASLKRGDTCPLSAS